MSRAGKAFELGGVVVPITAAYALRQRLEVVGGRNRVRFANGASLVQSAWSKRRVTLSGDGWAPLGLGGLNYNGTLVLKCGMPEAVRANSNVVALPAGRRSDSGYEPFARAHLATGDVVTAVTVVGNTATCTEVSGAISYSVWYYPQLTGWCEPPATDFDGAGASTAWELAIEEA